MEFSSPFFLFVFFPIFIIIFYLANPAYRLAILLIASVFLYAFFQSQNAILVIAYLILNFFFLKYIHNKFIDDTQRKKYSSLLIAINLVFFLVLKAFSSKIPFFQNTNFTYPLGFSIIFFQVISAIIDTRNRKITTKTSIFEYLTYFMMFPKIVMGPITRLPKIMLDFKSMVICSEDLIKGSKRFIIGLAKKVIIADQLATIVNPAFGLQKPAFSTPIAWVIIIAFTIQIYYDFSGYIDMGIGLAKMMGINLPENFDRPYTALNLAEFWRRWHITLTSWFRDYVFLPLEYKRRRVKFLRQESHILLIFTLTGLWHGFTINYLLWGVFQGLIIIIENSRIGNWIKKLPVLIQRFYFTGIILFSWILFRSDSVGYALRFIKRLVIFDLSVQPYPFSISTPLPIINNSILLILFIGILGLFNWQGIISKIESHLIFNNGVKTSVSLLQNFSYILILLLSIAVLTTQNFVPSIYGKF